jgi:hypothetical protein
MGSTQSGYGGPSMITYVDVVAIQPLVALVFGILILTIPRLLSTLVGIYFLLIGAVGIWPHLMP